MPTSGWQLNNVRKMGDYELESALIIPYVIPGYCYSYNMTLILALEVGRRLLFDLQEEVDDQ
jgi:hypothetical protein